MNTADLFLSLHLRHKDLISAIYDKLAGVRHAPLNKIKTAREQDLNLSASDNSFIQSLL